MRTLVTGGAGFIGSHLAEALLGAGHEVLILDNLASGARANVPARATFVEADVTSVACAKTIVDFAPAATKALAEYEAFGYGHLPVCVAKTHLSLSHDPNLKGRPTGFRLPIRDVRLAAGAGFIYPLAGDMRTMPGLPSHPAGEKIDIDADGNVVGLF